MRIARLPDYNANRTAAGKTLSQLPRFIGTANEHRYGVDWKAFEQHADAGLEGLQFPSGRKSAFREPDEIFFPLQNDGAQSKASASGACRFDRQILPSQLKKRMNAFAETMPVQPAQ